MTQRFSEITERYKPRDGKMKQKHSLSKTNTWMIKAM